MSVSGAYLECQIGGVAVAGLHRWEADDSEGAVLDATTGPNAGSTGGGGGFTDTDVGPAKLKIVLHLLYDVSEGIGMDLRRGTIVTGLALYRNAEDAQPAYSVPKAIVISKPQTVEVMGRCEATATLNNKGPYTENE